MFFWANSLIKKLITRSDFIFYFYLTLIFRPIPPVIVKDVNVCVVRYGRYTIEVNVMYLTSMQCI